VAISLSVVLLLAIILVVLIRGGSLKAGPAVVAVLFGFFLASTGMADDQLDPVLDPGPPERRVCRGRVGSWLGWDLPRRRERTGARCERRCIRRIFDCWCRGQQEIMGA
jgi:Ni/Co efflux regulator RcnB